MRTTPKTQSAARQSGHILVITLLAILLLSGLVFYVINLGDQANQRIVVQHTADSSAVAGGTTVARSFNTVAQNNVTMARYIAAINMLDGAPLTYSSTLPETIFFRDTLETRRAGLNVQSVSATLHNEIDTHLLDYINSLTLEADEQTGVDTFLSNNDVRDMTFYDGPNGRGRLWQAMKTLDNYSLATMRNMGEVAQTNAAAGATPNLSPNRDASAVMVPLSPDTVWVRGSFDDLRRPVVEGLLDESIDNEQVNRGPFDTVFGWRALATDTETEVVGIDVDGVDSPGQSPVGGGPNNSARRRVTSSEVIGYNTFGTQGQTWSPELGVPGWTLRSMYHFYLIRHRTWFRQIADAKLNMLWSEPRYERGNDFAVPRWSSGTPPLPSPGEPLSFSESAYVRVDIRSRYPMNHPFFLATGSWAYDQRATLTIRNGWWLAPTRNPTSGNTYYPTTPMAYNGTSDAANVVSVGNNAWLNEFEYTVTADYPIGITPVINQATGEVIPQPAYFLQLVIYVGYNDNPIAAGVFNRSRINRDNPFIVDALDDPGFVVTIRNPHEGLVHDDETLPAPIDFDHAVMGYSVFENRDALEYCAFARQSDRAIIWPSRFRGHKPYPYLVGIAQARVFNDHSWDLWTPMWQCKLVPIEPYERWAEALAIAAESGEGNATTDPEAMTALSGFIRDTEALAPVMLKH